MTVQAYVLKRYPFQGLNWSTARVSPSRASLSRSSSFTLREPTRCTTEYARPMFFSTRWLRTACQRSSHSLLRGVLSARPLIERPASFPHVRSAINRPCSSGSALSPTPDTVHRATAAACLGGRSFSFKATGVIRLEAVIVSSSHLRVRRPGPNRMGIHAWLSMRVTCTIHTSNNDTVL